MPHRFVAFRQLHIPRAFLKTPQPKHPSIKGLPCLHFPGKRKIVLLLCQETAPEIKQNLHPEKISYLIDY
jgi:hypothetical protein